MISDLAKSFLVYLAIALAGHLLMWAGLGHTYLDLMSVSEFRNAQIAVVVLICVPSTLGIYLTLFEQSSTDH